MTEVQAKKLATADDLRAEVDLLTARIDDLTRFLVEATTKRDQLRELARELLNAWIGIPALPPSAAPFHKARRIAKEKRSADQSALLAKAKALGIGGEG